MAINKNLLHRLISASGVSGMEFGVQKIILKELKSCCSDVRTDKFGNIYARKVGKGKKIMLSAHMDEIGLIIKSTDDKGRIRFSTIGGIEPLSVIGQRVEINGSKKIIGAITTKEMNNSSGIEEIPKTSDMFVDTGLNKKQLNKLGIGVGSILNLVQETTYLGSSEYICGKALDDRIGCYILLELARKVRSSKNDIYFVFTVQEEIGLYGGITSSYNIQPDWALIVDVTNADDADESPAKVLGGGATVTIKDENMVTNYCLDEWIKKISRKNKIPIQLDVSDGGTTEASTISVSGGGVPSTVVGVPIRNLHTTIGIANTKDIENCLNLLQKFLESVDKIKPIC